MWRKIRWSLNGARDAIAEADAVVVPGTVVVPLLLWNGD